MRKNLLRERLKAGEPSFGTHILSSWPGIVEIVGHTGVFDYVEFVSEYAPYDLLGLENIARGLELSGMSALMKIDQEPRTYLAAKALGAGIQNILFSDVRTVEDAKECVGAVRADLPGTLGRRGAGSTRDIGYVMGGASADWVQSTLDSVVMLMIEKKEAVENLDAILSVEGVDMVQFGPGDYSVSIGKAGSRNDPEIVEAQRHTIQTALKKGVQPRAEIGTPEAAESYLKMGVRHFCLGTDVHLLFQWWKNNGAALREIVKGA